MIITTHNNCYISAFVFGMWRLVFCICFIFVYPKYGFSPHQAEIIAATVMGYILKQNNGNQFYNTRKMKKIITLILLFSIISCSDIIEKKYVIKNFDKIITDTLSPKKDGQYTCQIIKLKGYVDDSIYVSFGGNSFKKYFKGDIDTLFNPDYYGGRDAVFIFNPYKAKKGNLEIEFSIQ